MQTDVNSWHLCQDQEYSVQNSSPVNLNLNVNQLKLNCRMNSASRAQNRTQQLRLYHASNTVVCLTLSRRGWGRGGLTTLILPFQKWPKGKQLRCLCSHHQESYRSLFLQPYKWHIKTTSQIYLCSTLSFLFSNSFRL